MKANHFDTLSASSGIEFPPAAARSLRLAQIACLIGGALAFSTTAFAQAANNTISDAQVEANVLKALASAPELAGEDIHTHTVYGVVTLTGSVRGDALQTRAENLAADANGVKKVVDELQIGAPTVAANSPADSDTPAGQIPKPSAAKVAPAPGSAPASAAVMNDPDKDQQQYQPPKQQTDSEQQTARDANQQQPYDQQPAYSEPSSQQPDYGRRPMQTDPGYAGAPEYGQYPDNQQGPPPQGPRRYPRGGYGQQRGYGQRSAYDGQQAGKSVTLPGDTTIRVRMNQTVSSDRSTPGSTFDATVESDVVADGTVAIPRGAQVTGTVVEATRAGVLKGRGDLTVALNSVTLGGRVFPLVTRPWSHHGGDKTIETVNKTAGFGAAGAVIGALAGGGEGAAVGGGIGAAAGLGSSATSGRGQVYLPAEEVVTFHLAQEASVTTVSEQEMQRLAYGAAPAPRPRYPRRPYPPIYVAPAYYPGYYRPYPGYYPGPYGYPPY